MARSALGELPRRCSRRFALNGFVYVLAGSDGTSGNNSVYVSAIGPDGGLGPWIATSPLLQGRNYFAAVVSGDWVYVLGGSDSTGAVQYAETERAQILID